MGVEGICVDFGCDNSRAFYSSAVFVGLSLVVSMSICDFFGFRWVASADAFMVVVVFSKVSLSPTTYVVRRFSSAVSMELGLGYWSCSACDVWCGILENPVQCVV